MFTKRFILSAVCTTWKKPHVTATVTKMRFVELLLLYCLTSSLPHSKR